MLPPYLLVPPSALQLPDDFVRVFSRGDFDVTPPMLIRPHLPTVGAIGIPPDQLGVVDIIVTEDGRVEQVRLVNTSRDRAYYDAMILSAVKAWMFKPAARSGQPVRYRMQIRLT
jgi:TonB family protein